MLRITIFLCVILLVRADGENQRKIKEILKGPDHDHGLKQQILELREIVNNLIVDISEEGGRIAQADLTELQKSLSENKVKVSKKPVESEEEKSEENLRKSALQITTRDALQRAKEEVVTVALEAAKHCRGVDDIVLGELLGEKGGNKRALQEGGCLESNPKRQNLIAALTDLESIVFSQLNVLVENLVNKLVKLLENASNFDFRAASVFDENVVRKATKLKTESAVEGIDKLLPVIVASAKRLDNDKHKDKVVEKLKEVLGSQDKYGEARVVKALMAIVQQGEKSYKEIEKTVL